jgi:peptide/nickel transport system ATP-binding protein
VLDLFRSLRDVVRCAFLFITHDLGVAAQIADRIAVMYAGRVMELGPANQVLQAPAHPYTTALLRSRIEMRTNRRKPLTTIPGEPPNLVDPPHGCPFAPRCRLHIAQCDAEPPPLLSAGDGQIAACIRIADAMSHRGANGQEADWSLVSAEPTPIAQLKDIHRDFRVWTSTFKREQLHAIRGVDLLVRRGECIALVGESGCGKSTLLRIVAGLLQPDRGSVELAPGANVQMVFQDAGASLTPWLTVGELVAERLLRTGLSPAERTARLERALAMVGLDRSVIKVRPRQLSGGQRQRAAFARAIVVPPKLLICDEPTSSLDVSLAAVVLNMVGRLRRELNLAVLFVTHDLAAARVVADRIAVMYLGQIVEDGPVDQVTSSPAHPYTKALISAVPGLSRVVTLAKGEPGNPLAIPSGCPFHPRCLESVDACRTTVPALLAMRAQADRSAACILVEH